MATGTSTSARRARNEAAQTTSDASWDFGLDMTRGATDVWGRSLQASMSTMTTLMDLTAQLQREFFESAMTGAKHSMDLWSEMFQGSADWGSSRFRETVDTLADKMKDSTSEISSLAGEAADQSRQATRSATNRAS